MAKVTSVKFNIRALNIYLLVILLIILFFGLYSLVQVQQALKAPEPPESAKITVTVIPAPDCEDCIQPESFIAAIKQLPLVDVTENILDHDSKKAQELIGKYNIEKLPAAIVTGEIEELEIPSFTKADDAHVFAESPPPYYDISSGSIEGLVSITYLTDAGCPLCFDVTQFGAQLKQLGVAIGSEEELEYSGGKAKSLIVKYDIRKIPTVILSAGALEYPIIAQVWEQVGSQEEDGTLVLRNATPPYKNIETGLVQGLVTLTLLYDESCTECYNVSMHEVVLQQSFGMKFKKINVYDISSGSGKSLKEKYDVTLVPTMLLDKEAEAYPGFEQAWSSVGTKEEDGAYIFRQVDLLEGVQYKDLSTGEIKGETTS